MEPVLNALIMGLSCGSWLMGFILSVLVGLLLIALGILGCIGIYDEITALAQRRRLKQKVIKNANSVDFQPTFIKTHDDET